MSFERFTERARQVLVLAQDEARQLKHNYIGTEHLLLGLFREEEGIGARVLASLGLNITDLRQYLRFQIGEGDVALKSQIPMTPRAKKVCEFALREALSLGHTYVGTEHLLLGLMREGGGVAVAFLLQSDVDAEKVRNEVIRTLTGPGRGLTVGTQKIPSLLKSHIEKALREAYDRGFADGKRADSEKGAA